MNKWMITVCMSNGKEFDGCIMRDTSDHIDILDEILSEGSEYIGFPMQNTDTSIALRRDHISSISVLKLEDI